MRDKPPAAFCHPLLKFRGALNLQHILPLPGHYGASFLWLVEKVGGGFISPVPRFQSTFYLSSYRAIQRLL